MPGAGKSTVGHWLATRLDLPFLDTDGLIVAAAGQPLQAIVDREGTAGLRHREEAALLTLASQPAVIATGGSAVYSEKGMAHLRELAVMVHLDCDLATLIERLGDHRDRGLVKRDDQSLADLYGERNALYRRHADLTVDAAAGEAAEVGARILAGLEQLGGSPK